MRTLSGAVLILASEQAFAHAHLANFPHDRFVRDVLLPASCLLLGLGAGLMAWGLVSERRSGKVAS